MKISEGGSILTPGVVQRLDVKNHTYYNTTTTGDLESGSRAITLGTINLAGTSNLTFSDISLSNSSVTFMTIERMINSASVQKLISYTNISYTDSSIPYPTSLFTTKGLVNEANIKFSFKNLTLKNIEFSTQGQLLKFTHLLPISVEIDKMVAVGITKGNIVIASLNKGSSQLSSKILFTN